jgi:hypothetical protein
LHSTHAWSDENPEVFVICGEDLQNPRSATGAFKELVGGPSGLMRRPAQATSSNSPMRCVSIGASVVTPSMPPSAAPWQRWARRTSSEQGKAVVVAVEGRRRRPMGMEIGNTTEWFWWRNEMRITPLVIAQDGSENDCARLTVMAKTYWDRSGWIGLRSNVRLAALTG